VLEFLNNGISRYKKQIYNIFVTDFDDNGLSDVLVSVNGQPAPIYVYSATAADNYGITDIDTSNFPSDFMGTLSPMFVTDVNNDGSKEVYIGARTGMKVWVVTNCTNLATAFQEENFHLIGDLNLLMGGEWSGNHLRGGYLGDIDNNGRPNIYFGARKNLDALFDIEWIGGEGGDVTDPDNYIMSALYQDKYPDFGNDVVALVADDLDGDGMDHQDLVVIHGAGNTGLPGIFILE